jgi:hypothetical protein
MYFNNAILMSLFSLHFKDIVQQYLLMDKQGQARPIQCLENKICLILIPIIHLRIKELSLEQFDLFGTKYKNMTVNSLLKLHILKFITNKLEIF